MFQKWRKPVVLAVGAVSLASLAAWYNLRAIVVGPPQATTPPPNAPTTSANQLESRFASDVRPFIERYCFKCHGSNRPKAELDLSRDTTLAGVAGNLRQWALVLDRLQAGEMPPEEAKRQPSPAERAVVVAWLRDLQEFESQQSSDDPGSVLAHRLSNAEYDYTIRDLTGVDLRPARTFPVDPANEAGFDNSGESLAMSPALLKK